MRRLMLLIVVVGSMLWVSGCVAVTGERRVTREVHVFRAPRHRVVEVVRAPVPPLRPHRHDNPDYRR
jgi:hypothetical protein